MQFGKSFEELKTNEKKAVGGAKGGAARAGHTADPEHVSLCCRRLQAKHLQAFASQAFASQLLRFIVG